MQSASESGCVQWIEMSVCVCDLSLMECTTWVMCCVCVCQSMWCRCTVSGCTKSSSLSGLVNCACMYQMYMWSHSHALWTSCAVLTFAEVCTAAHDNPV